MSYVIQTATSKYEKVEEFENFISNQYACPYFENAFKIVSKLVKKNSHIFMWRVCYDASRVRMQFIFDESYVTLWQISQEFINSMELFIFDN